MHTSSLGYKPVGIPLLILTLCSCLLFSNRAAAQTSAFLPLQEIQPGMKCTGRTVFKGDRIEEFQGEILGILKNIGPNQNAIIARLSGGVLGKTGIFAGMSGSPVFVDNRLIGAVAWSFPFLTEPIAGITPIQEMVDAFQSGGPAKVPGPTIQTGSTRYGGWRTFRQNMDPFRWASSAFQGRSFSEKAQWKEGGFLADRADPNSFQTIATPIVFSGFDARTLHQFSPGLRSLGMIPMRGGTQGVAGSASMDPDLQPGSTIAVSLVTGDMDISASGTVTHRQGKTIYAFGHPFLQLGGTDMPFSKAHVLEVLPSLESSMKLSVGTELAGVIKQDRATGIMGVLGETAEMIPVTVTAVSDRRSKRSFRYWVINDRYLTPLLLNLTIFNTLISTEKAMGYSTMQMKSRISLEGQPDIQIDQNFASIGDTPIGVSLAVAIPVNYLMACGYEDFRLKGINVDVVSSEEARTITLDHIWYDRTEARPGEEVLLHVYLKKENGQEIEESYPVKIPEDVPPGTLQILVADGESMERFEAQETPQDFIPKNLSQVVKLINNFKKNDRLYVRLFRRETGASVGAEGLPGLPPSIYSLMQSARTKGGFDYLPMSSYMEYELPTMDYVVDGSKSFSLRILP